MRVPPNYILVEKTNYSAIGKFNIKTSNQARVLAVPGVANNDYLSEHAQIVDENEVVLLKQRFSKYLELEEDKIYLVPIDDILIIFDESDIFNMEENNGTELQ